MPSFNLLVTICLLYVGALFLVAYMAERWSAQGRLNILRSPLVYTLSISVYCTAWTFYGAVGSAARNGLEFIAIYLGPTLVFIGWWWLLRRLVQIGHRQRITSIADLVSSRYGKSNTLAVIVTLLAVIGTTPYIALQLQSLTLSFAAFTTDVDVTAGDATSSTTALYVAMGLAAFTIAFGTRNINANERHTGVVMAIAVEAVVKLVALLAVGIFVVWILADGPRDIFARMPDGMLRQGEVFSSRWVTLMVLSATAIICLPRMFQVIVVENSDERHLATASWAFPLYLFLMSLFVLPIAIAGKAYLAPGANPDLFVLTVPLEQGQTGLATLALLGGFSSATSMVIVAAIALSTMVSNHIVLPLWLRVNTDRNPESDDVRTLLLRSRRVSIAVVLLLGYLYYEITGGTDALASIGLIAFLGVAQVLPAMLGGMFWPGATRVGALCGICAGFLMWAYTLFLPSFGGAFILSEAAIETGVLGLNGLRPQALFGIAFEDALVHAVFWSLGTNTLVFVVASLLSEPAPMERLQGVAFTQSSRNLQPDATVSQDAVPEDLLVLAQRILGRSEAMAFFNASARGQGKSGGLPDPTAAFLTELEREFAGSVGAATAHAMIGQVTGTAAVSVEDMIAVADETAQIMEYSARLEEQSQELTETAAELRNANAKLMELGEQKDSFLSQVSHELRTPMTSIRSFAEILRDGDSIGPAKRQHYADVIHAESIRLTRLLDDILDLSFMENSRIQLHLEEVKLADVIDKALTTTDAQIREKGIEVIRDPSREAITLTTDIDRLAQVIINLVSNALKYCDAPQPRLEIAAARSGSADLVLEIADNGAGVAEADVETIFQKFSKLSGRVTAGSAGLGLPISREIMRNLGGSLTYLADRPGATFQITLPVQPPQPPTA